ncbi:MAG: hypothetical protein II184_07030, partial [Clostridia bacterium]|nr:hypothetical protein [Clostridia bacterium]
FSCKTLLSDALQEKCSSLRLKMSEKENHFMREPWLKMQESLTTAGRNDKITTVRRTGALPQKKQRGCPNQKL